MSRWQRAAAWFNPFRSGTSDEYVDGHAPEDAARGTRGDSVKKQRKDSEPDRRAGLPAELKRQVADKGGVPKPYDPGLLKQVADHPVTQAYIDTMAQDAATAPWSITQRDERIDVGDEQLAEAERTLESLHPEKSFRDLREMGARGTLTLGDGAWVKHYYNDGELAEAIPIDTARIYKVVDEHGLTRGYVEVSKTRREVTNEYDLEEVVWFEWASRNDHVYGEGPVEKGYEAINVLEELSEKEVKDLSEGMPPGIVSVAEDEDTPMAVDAYEEVKDNWELKEGERHRAIVSMGDWQFTPLSPGYNELQFLDRSKFWINVLGAVFKVNAPYAGFDFQEGNKAQNQAQAEAYAQRGFRVLLRQMEEAINRQLIWPDISEDIKFEFEVEQSLAERQEHAEYLRTLADAAEQWDNLGRNVTYRDGALDIDDGEVEAPEDTGSEGAGFFASTDAEAKDTLTKEQVQKLDDALLQCHREQVQPESLDDIQKASWSGDSSVPEYVREAVVQAIQGGAVFQDIEGVPEATVGKLEEILQESITQPQGWSLRSIVDRMQQEWPGVSEAKLEVVARTETASILNKAREDGYRERDDAATHKFKWQGPQDGRTTDACEELKNRTNPEYGGRPMSLPALVREQREVSNAHHPDLEFRKHLPHISCRHTFVRVVEDAPREGIAPGAVESPRDDVPQETATQRRS